MKARGAWAYLLLACSSSERICVGSRGSLYGAPPSQDGPALMPFDGTDRVDGSARETCNGVDDDGNGRIDDGPNGCGGICSLEGTPGAACDGADRDECQDDHYECITLNEVRCSTGDDTPDVCGDGLDNDCNGVTDDTCAWLVFEGGSDQEELYGLSLATDGSVALAGRFRATSVFGPPGGRVYLSSTGGNEAFVARLAADGTLDWARSAGGAGDDRASGIVALADGETVAVGSYEAAATFGAGESSEALLPAHAASPSVFIARFRDDGSLDWARSAGGVGLAEALGVAAASDGGAFFTGTFGAGVTFGAGEAAETTLGFGGVFVARYSADGTLAWAREEDCRGWCEGLSMVTVPGGFAVAGELGQMLTFDAGQPGETTLTGTGASDAFAASFTDVGALSWARPILGTNPDSIGTVAATPDGGLVVTGTFTRNLDIGDPPSVSLTSAGNEDVYLVRLRPDGATAWAVRAGGTEYDRGLGVAVSPDGAIVVTGHYEDAAVFGPGETGETTLRAAGSALFVARYREDGSLVSARNIAEGNNCGPLPVAVTPEGDSIVIAGTVVDAVSFEPDGTAYDGGRWGDLFVWKGAP